MIEVLNYIQNELKKMNINYEFMEWKSKIVYPYFVGECLETESNTEDGKQEKEFILTGFTRGSYLELLKIAKKIEQRFSPISGRTAILENKSGIAVFYSNSQMIPTGEMELKKIQINLSIKEWSVE